MDPMKLIVLGATGSVGRSTLDLVKRNPDRFDVVALVANSDAEGLAALARDVSARCAVLANQDRGTELTQLLAGSGIECGVGESAVLEAASRPADMVVAAIVGAAGLRPTLAAISPGKTIALANKECLVSAGKLFMASAAAANATILPVDSEHNAIFQVLEDRNRDHLEKIVLTASGGPFRTFDLDQMAKVTPEQALKHPNWDMGARITIDSATMMNKGLELIEAKHLFSLEPDQLEVLVHPQSVVHGLVQYQDGSLLAQLGAPDMRTPIAHCLAWPDRMHTPVERLDLAAIGALHFEKPDLKRFPALAVAMESMENGNGAPAVLNAADEIAVEAFLNGQIGYLEIAVAVRSVIEEVDRAGELVEPMDVDAVYHLDRSARDRCREWILRR